MAASQFDPLSPGPRDADGQRPVDRVLLEKVLQETLLSRPAAGAGAGLEALRDVGRRFRGAPLNDEAATELIEVLLITALPAAKPAERQQMAARIARTLLDDDAAHERLQAFWARLTEE